MRTKPDNDTGKSKNRVVESYNGEHWEETHSRRPLETMTRGDIVWFIIAHILLLPLALITLALTALCLPLYRLWAWRRGKKSSETEIHGEVEKILGAPRVDVAFMHGVKPESKPDISVVMPFYNRAKWVDWAVGSVLRQELPVGTLVELIAVDNGSDDDTVEKLERHPIRVIHCAERGPGAARNAGIAAARAPIVAFTDSDCVADTHWLKNLTRLFFEEPDLLIAGGRILSLEDDGFISKFTNEENILNNERFFMGAPYFPRFFATANSACRLDALKKIDGFDNSLWMSEDADLSWRIMDLGGKMAYRDDAVVYHQHRHNLGSLFRQASDYGAASASIFAKHRESLEATAALSWKNIRDLAWSPFNLIWDQFTAETVFDRQRELIYALWRLGFTYGSIKESIKRRVFFL